jgi:hypothetical protein
MTKQKRRRGVGEMNIMAGVDKRKGVLLLHTKPAPKIVCTVALEAAKSASKKQL